MKKTVVGWFLLLLAVMLMLGALTACGGEDTNTPPDPTPASGKTCTVTFMDGDTVVETQTVAKGGTFRKPAADMSKTGHTFDGWFRADGSSVKWNSKNDLTVDADLVIYAKYTVLTYDVRYFVLDRQIGEAEHLTFGDALSIPSAEALGLAPGVEFVGWTLRGEETILTSEEMQGVYAPEVSFTAALRIRSYETAELVGFRERFSYYDTYYAGEDATVRVRFADGTYYDLEEDAYRVEVPDGFGKKLGTYEIKVVSRIDGIPTLGYRATVEPAGASFKVLFIGNSYSDDTIAWAGQLAKSAGIENILVADLFYPGCTIAQHAAYAADHGKHYIFRRVDGEGNMISSCPDGQYDTTMEMGITYTDWDWIIFQGGPAQSGIPAEYARLGELLSYVKERATNPNVKFAFHMTWAYSQGSTDGMFSIFGNSQTTMYEAIVGAVRSEVCSVSDFLAIIPTGTAIQNTRTSFIGDNLTRDIYEHLTDPLGRYIASMMLIRTLTGFSPEDMTFVPTGVTEAQKLVAMESVLNAFETPFAVTPSAYREAPAAAAAGQGLLPTRALSGTFPTPLREKKEILTEGV